MSKRVGKAKTSRSLVAALVITFSTLVLSALLIVNVSVLFFFGQAIQESVIIRQQLTAREAANTVASFVQEKFSELEATVKISEPTLASQQEQRNVLGKLVGLVPAFRQVILFDAQDGELVTVSRVSQTAGEQLLARVEPDLFAQVRQGNRYVSPAYIDELTSEPMIILAVAAADAFGDFQGTLLAEVNLKFIWDLVDRLEVGEGGVAYVVDKQGNLLAFGDISRVLRGENVSQLDVVGEFMHNPVPVGEAATSLVPGIDDTTVAATYVPLGMPEWAVVTELPLIEAFQRGIQSTLILGAVMLVVTTLVVLLAVYTARRLAAPLLDLTTTAGRIAEGEMALRAALEGPTEVVNLAEAFNTMTVQLRELIGSLEQRVADRTRGLQAAAEVARVTTSVLDPDELLRQTADLIRERLDLYYVGLFLLDKQGSFAVLRAGTGNAGQQMVAEGYRVGVGDRSPIGRCVGQGQASFALDVHKDADYVTSPLLPDTRSEMVLPLISRDRVIGAMTVQHTAEAAFDDEDLAVMQTMADQVAVALDNARLFAETEAALQEMETIQRHYMGSAWIEYSRSRPIRGYQQTEAGLVPLGNEILPEVRRVMTASEPENRGDGGNTDPDREPSPEPDVVVPLELRGQLIGALGFRQAEGRRQWSDEEIEVVQAIAQEFALAADNLRLMEDTQRRAARERTLAEVTGRMRESLDLDAVLQNAVREMRQALGADVVEVQLTEVE